MIPKDGLKKGGNLKATPRVLLLNFKRDPLSQKPLRLHLTSSHQDLVQFLTQILQSKSPESVGLLNLNLYSDYKQTEPNSPSLIP